MKWCPGFLILFISFDCWWGSSVECKFSAGLYKLSINCGLTSNFQINFNIEVLCSPFHWFQRKTLCNRLKKSSLGLIYTNFQTLGVAKRLKSQKSQFSCVSFMNYALTGLLIQGKWTKTYGLQCQIRSYTMNKNPTISIKNHSHYFN